MTRLEREAADHSGREFFPPLVSILMPVLNAEAHLSQALDSILAQTTSSGWEAVLVDDGSTDRSLAIAYQYAAAFPHCFRVYQHEGARNCGTSASRNLALQHARGEVIAMLDADDVWLPGMLEEQLALLARYPEADLVYANAERTWDMALPYQPGRGSLGDNELPTLLPAGAHQGLLPAGCPLPWFLEDETLVPCTCTVLVRTAAAREVNGFESSFHGLYDDQAFYAKLMLQGRAAVQDVCVARYRRHPASCCGQAWHNHPLQAHARQRFLTWLADYAQGVEAEAPCLLAAD